MSEKILIAIDKEIAKLQQVRALIAGPGRTAPNATVPQKPKRALSPEARKAIADAQRKRWAKVKGVKAAKPAAKKVAAGNKK